MTERRQNPVIRRTIVLVVDRNSEAGQGSTRSSSAMIRSLYGTRQAIALAYEGRKTFEAWPEHLDIAEDATSARIPALRSSLALPGFELE